MAEELDEIRRVERAMEKQKMPPLLLIVIGALTALAALLLFYSF
jgi:hypothetical protein